MSLQGTLKTLGITEVLEFLAARNATGQLDVTTEMGTAAYLFSDGDIAQSEYSFIRERGNDAAEATYYVVTEVDGTFFFDEDEGPVDSSDSEDVASVLGRTADIAERWLEVEESIPTPNHELVRNDELDGSVTIQPEWWKALEVIGTGKTSLQVADQLSMGVLEASLLLLAMTDAGLLNVQQPDALDIEITASADEVETVAPIAEAPVEAPQPEAAIDVEPLNMIHEPAVAPAAAEDPSPITMMTAPVAEPAVEPVIVPSAFDEPIAAQPLAAPEMPEATYDAPVEPIVVPEPAPVAFAPLPEIIEPLAAPETPTSFIESFEPAHQPPAVDPVEPAMEMHEIIEPVLAQPPVIAPVDAAPQPPVVVPVADENDGWSSNHSPSYEAPAQAPAPEQMLAPMPTEHSGADMFESNPVESAAPEMAAAPVVDQIEPDHNAQNTAMAGEVLSDLATLSDQLGEPADAEPNWQLDGTFVAEEAPTVAPADNDPFGDLGELLSDTDEEDRGSVLKFLRRD